MTNDEVQINRPNLKALPASIVPTYIRGAKAHERPQL